MNDNDIMDDDFMADSSPQMMQSKMNSGSSNLDSMPESKVPENVDLLADFGNEEFDEKDNGPESEDQAEILR